MEEEFGPRLSCAHCGAESFIPFKYCGRCGQKREALEQQYSSPIESTDFKLAIVFIALELVILITYQFTEIFDELQSRFEFMDFLLNGLAVLFAFLAGWKSLHIRFKDVQVKVVALVLPSAVLAAILVNFIADFINYNLVDDYFDFPLYTYQGLVYSILMIGVMPAIFEELAYRGFLFTQLKSITNARASLVVTSIVFGLAHFSIVGLLWLIPLGYAFGWLRLKYKTIVYGMLAHFVYNTAIVLMEYIEYQ